jgi:hypothetical protein
VLVLVLVLVVDLDVDLVHVHRCISIAPVFTFYASREGCMG